MTRASCCMRGGLTERQAAIAALFAARCRAPAGLRGGARARSRRPARSRAAHAAQCRRRHPRASEGRAASGAACCGSISTTSGCCSISSRRALPISSAAGSRATWSRARFAFDGIVGNYAAPSTPGTAYVLLHHCFGEVNGKRGAWGHAIGGMGAITPGDCRGRASRGARDPHWRARRALLTRDGKRRGVVLASARRSRRARSPPTSPPKLLFRDLVPEEAVAPELRGAFRRHQVGLRHVPHERGAQRAAGLHLPPGQRRRRTTTAPASSSGRRSTTWSAPISTRAATAGRRAPVVEMLIPSTLDPTLAPAGKHVASLFVQHVAPQLPAGRSWAGRAREGSLRRSRHRDRQRGMRRTSRPRSSPGRSCRRSISNGASAWSTAISSTARCRSISSSRRGRCSAMPTIACRCRASTCAGRAPIRAAA